MTASQIIRLASLMLGVAYAQRPTTTATCGIDFDWMFNPGLQSPCLVAAYLQGACGSGAWTVPALPSTGAQQAYLPPNATTANICTCSSAVYNLMSACAACQGGGWLLFAPWSVECGNAHMLTLPDSFPVAIPIPANTTIPDYALVDPRAWSGGGFNTTEARGVALGAIPPTLALSTSASGTAAAVIPSTTPSSTTNGASSLPRQDNTSLIVGGVVGGTLGVALVTVIMLWLFCGKRLQSRFNSHDPPLTGQNILGRAFTTPTTPPALTNIVIPVPVRPYPLKRAFQSFMSASTTASNADDRPNPHPLITVSPKTTTEGHNIDTYRAGPGMESGGVQFSQEPAVRRTNSTSSVAHTLFRRMTLPWRRQRHRMTVSSISLGSGTVMTSNPADSDAGPGSRNVSRQNTTRRMTQPTPFVMPDHAEDIPTLDISSGRPPTGQIDSNQQYGTSASDEKRRLNPPAYVAPPMAVHGLVHAPGQRLEHMEPTAGHSASFLDLASGAATAGSGSNDGHGRTPGSTLPQEPRSASRYRPDSDPLSLPSNLVLSSPQEVRSQDASSGLFDASPVVARPLPSSLRFVVSNPSRDVEM